ncbi:hypothetical protein [Senegalia massiliensis]|uniref:Uncharacterized protein n=1 Tax=Senegalia massiliensis TaxID=1720316 RepID=A0A845QVG2_9CLOT|nr:hypothetical protein [Senegalia massiliensis]NBI05779.1 hypothetical protein [Senegalia massiliensis]
MIERVGQTIARELQNENEMLKTRNERLEKELNSIKNPLEFKNKILVLDKNDTLKEHFYKFEEEASELKHEMMIQDIMGYCNRENVIAEAMDVIQVCIGILDYCRATEEDIEKHNNKLLCRGWNVKQVYNII